MKAENQSNVDYSSNLTPAEDYLLAGVMAIAGILSIVLNSSVFHVASHDWKKIKVIEVYSVFLAVADFFMTLTLFPMVIASAFYHKWIFGNVGCQIYAFSGFFYGITSIGILATFSVLRYIKICKSHAGSHITPRLVRWSLVLIISFAMLWSILPFLGWGAYDFETTMLSCTLNWHDDVQVGYITCAFVIAFAAPTIVIVFSYTAILLFIKKQHTPRFRPSYGIKQLKLAISMCIGFIFAWSPYASVSMWAAYGDSNSIPVRVTAVPVFMAKLATVYNPVIYFFDNKLHRKTLFGRIFNFSNIGMDSSNSNVTSIPAITLQVLPYVHEGNLCDRPAEFVAREPDASELQPAFS